METCLDLPNILVLSGITIQMYKSIDKQFEENLLESIDSDNENEKVIYNKIPQRFNNLDTYQIQTNLKCWYCDLNFITRPIFIPKVIKNNYEMTIHGNFCSFSCAITYININIKNKDVQWRYRDNLYVLYKLFNGTYPLHINPAPNKFDLECYGGELTQDEFRKKLE